MFSFLESTEASTQSGGFSGGIITIVMLVAMVALFYFLMYRPQKKQEKEAKNMVGYMKTLFFRFLVSQLMCSHHITKNASQFVPVQDCKQEWTDEKLNKKYGLSEEEVAFIDASIRAYD